MIDAVLFDLGDTIINFGVGRREAELLFRRGARVTYDFLEARGTALPEFDRYFNVHHRGMVRAYLWSKLIRRDFSYADVLNASARKLGLAFTPREISELCCLWYRPIAEASHIDGGVRHMLHQLRNAGTKLAIVSNTFVPPHCLDGHLEREGLLEFFPVRIYSSSVRYRKPHPRIFELALDQIGVPASRALFIGDLLVADIAGAKRAGMRTIWKPGKPRAGGRPRLGAPHFSFLRHNRHHTPDFTIPKVTQLPEALRHFGWRPSRHFNSATILSPVA
jgi:putative hydrolase of the HAD superfamily